MRYSGEASVAVTSIVFVVCALSAPSGAQQSRSAGRTGTIACSEETTRIDGIGQSVRLTGECRTVVVSGSGNRVVVERVGSLKVSGTDNHVRWERSLEGSAPHVLNSGIKNIVTRVTPATGTDSAADTRLPEKPGGPSPAAPPSRVPAPTATSGSGAASKNGDRLVVKSSSQTLTVDCASRQVLVSGSVNIVTLTGACGQISVTGTGNKITVESTPRIVTTGHDNEITWQKGEGDRPPSVRNSGMKNTVRRGSL
jgi:hypothetical protein